jgi:hypothetical protein
VKENCKAVRNENLKLIRLSGLPTAFDFAVSYCIRLSGYASYTDEARRVQNEPHFSVLSVFSVAIRGTECRRSIAAIDGWAA